MLLCLTVPEHPCHAGRRVAERDPSETFNREAAVARLYADIERAKELAFNKVNDAEQPAPDLVALPKLLELQAKVYGLLSADGKRGAAIGETIDVPLEKVEQLVKAAKLKLKEKKDDEEG